MERFRFSDFCLKKTTELENVSFSSSSFGRFMMFYRPNNQLVKLICNYFKLINSFCHCWGKITRRGQIRSDSPKRGNVIFSWSLIVVWVEFLMFYEANSWSFYRLVVRLSNTFLLDFPRRLRCSLSFFLFVSRLVETWGDETAFRWIRRSLTSWTSFCRSGYECEAALRGKPSPFSRFWSSLRRHVSPVWVSERLKNLQKPEVLDPTSRDAEKQTPQNVLGLYDGSADRSPTLCFFPPRLSRFSFLKMVSCFVAGSFQFSGVWISRKKGLEIYFRVQLKCFFYSCNVSHRSSAYKVTLRVFICCNYVVFSGE